MTKASALAVRPTTWPSLLTAAALATTFLAGSACNKKDEGSTDKPSPGAQGETPAQSAEELAAPIATIDGYVITVGEFQERINRQSPYIRARYTSLEQRKEFLDNLIRFEVLAQEAQKRGLNKDPDVVRTMKQVMIQKLMKAQFEDAIKPEDIGDAEMKAFYDEHADEYNKPEQVRASAIVLKDKKSADKVAKEAKSDAGKTNKGFRELVSKHSVDDASKQRGGDLRYFDEGTTDIPAPVVKAAFAIAKTGDVTGPVAGGDGTFYILKQTGRRKALSKPFDSVRRQIQNRIYRDKRTKAQKDFIDGLRNGAKIEIMEDALNKVQIDTSNPAPGMPAVPHGGGGPTHDHPPGQ